MRESERERERDGGGRSVLKQDNTFILSALLSSLYLSLRLLPVIMSALLPPSLSLSLSLSHSLTHNHQKLILSKKDSDKKGLTSQRYEPTTFFSASHALTN